MPNICSVVNHAVGQAEGAVQQVTQTAQNAEASTSQAAEAAAGDAEGLVTEATEVLLGIATSMQASGEAGLAGIKAGISTSADVLGHIADQARWTTLLAQSALSTLATKGATAIADGRNSLDRADQWFYDSIYVPAVYWADIALIPWYPEYVRHQHYLEQKQQYIDAILQELKDREGQKKQLMQQIFELQREMLSLIFRLRTDKGQFGQGAGGRSALMGLVRQIKMSIAQLEVRIKRLDEEIQKCLENLARLEGHAPGGDGSGGTAPSRGGLAGKLQHSAEIARGVQRLQTAQLRLAHTVQSTVRATPKAMQAVFMIRRIHWNIQQITRPVPKARRA